MAMHTKHITGPMQAAHHRLSKNPELVRWMNAVEASTRWMGRSPTRTVLEACIDAYAPDLRKNQDFERNYDRDCYQGFRRNDIESLMVRLRVLRRQGHGSVSWLIERAVVTWLDKNVARLAYEPNTGIEWAMTHEDAQQADDLIAGKMASLDDILRVKAMVGGQTQEIRDLLAEPEDATMP